MQRAFKLNASFWLAAIARPVLMITLAFGTIVYLGGCGPQSADQSTKLKMNSEALPRERPLPDATSYNSQFTNCFPNESLPNPNSANVYVCGAVQKPKVLKMEAGMTVGAAIAKCGGLNKAFDVTILRKRGDAYSSITIGLIEDSYKPTGYERIALQRDDLIVASRESF